MESNDIINKLINNLVDDIKEEVSPFSRDNAFDKYIITIRNNLNKDDYIGFLKDIYVNVYTVQVAIADDFESVIGVNIYFDKDTDYFYRIRFTDYNEMIDYCTCAFGDEGYDPRYNCCGEHCDWIRPGFNLSKVTVIGSEKYKGLEKNLWNELDEFRGISEEDKKKVALEREIEEINLQIEELQEQLFKLKGECEEESEVNQFLNHKKGSNENLENILKKAEKIEDNIVHKE